MTIAIPAITGTPTARRCLPLIGLAMLWSASAAQAQSTVTLYGVVDNALRHTRGLDAANAASTLSSTAISSGVNTTSRFGLRGVEDLGGGLKAVFGLESGLNADSGASVSTTKLFDRSAVVGLQGPWGSVTAGRQTTVLADVLGGFDPLGVRYAGFNPNVSIAALSAHRLGIEYGPAGSTTGAYRLDNSVKYVGRFGPVNLRAMQAWGEQAGSSGKLSSTGVGAGYQSGGYAATLAYAQFKNAAGLTLKGYLGGASAMVGNSKLSVTYGSHEAETTATARTRNRTLGLGGTVPLNAHWDLVLAHYQVKRARTAAVGDGFNRSVGFLEYKLSKRTRLYAEVDHTRWKNGYQGAAFKSSASGVSAGVVHSF